MPDPDVSIVWPNDTFAGSVIFQKDSKNKTADCCFKRLYGRWLWIAIEICQTPEKKNSGNNLLAPGVCDIILESILILSGSSCLLGRSCYYGGDWP